MTSIFRYSKNYGSLTHETGIKDAVNMEDLICLLATVRTLQSNSFVFFYFDSKSYVLYCLSDEKVRISKIIVEILLKSNSYVFYYFKSNSYVLYCLSDEKVRIWKIIVEILLKSNSYVFYYFKSNSYVLHCLSDEKVRIS